MVVKVINRSGNALPAYETPLAAGMDVRADMPESIILGPLERALVPTGLFVELPEGFEMQVRPRSGLAAKHGVTVLNAPGTIDADYRGEIKVILQRSIRFTSSCPMTSANLIPCYLGMFRNPRASITLRTAAHMNITPNMTSVRICPEDIISITSIVTHNSAMTIYTTRNRITFFLVFMAVVYFISIFR